MHQNSITDLGFPERPPVVHSASSSFGGHVTVSSVSTTFSPGSPTHTTPSDLILLSNDRKVFYVHFSIIVKSENNFNSLLPIASFADPALLSAVQMPVMQVPESSHVMDIILHVIYNLSWVQTPVPPFGHMIGALDVLPKYGFSISSFLLPSTILFDLFVRLYAPALPMEVYCFAAAHDINHLAVAASPHLLSYPLPALTDELASKMGARYLRRLVFLHLGRQDALRRLLTTLPVDHPPDPECGPLEQKRLASAWAFASAYVGWDARPNITGAEIKAILAPLAETLTCAQCKMTFLERTSTLIADWGRVRMSIIP
ncbi:hypothetical protein PUNSTDRAFT_109594 [Punctularia strigosozonata HHB-11173 SS5]|uniref:uncharacterized protein n=1 Tax=Punctularia strigosozonata (strain HHB-11173) TaxID=741275 RepID=UPI00044174F2|nr:uncharacterized protein PUNSTDRAFT_109594 [Punctularia strigosozonata HHB-11173 SS5]EIN13356.1 hypothetical protein PUNSTDRAFT_109594 [Punctularia strigosozonata HHB-11173 SS5]